jgi:outer membrane lipoprotein-sorting protein
MTAQRKPTLLAACMMTGAIGLAGTSAADLFDEIYARGKPVDAALRTLTARFTETSQSPLLLRPLVATGTIAVVRPFRVAMHYATPDNRTVIIDGGKLRVVWPARSIDSITSIGATERRIQRYFVDSSPKELRTHFDIMAALATDRPAAWFVTLSPRRKQILAGMSRLELWIDRQTMMPAAMQMIFPSGDAKLLEFDDVQINPKIDESAFRPRKD